MTNAKDNPCQLSIYKASAGSGKTFTLSIEYIKLLIKNPYCYKTILAVTFTNKATEEMKMRILSQLYGIWKRLPDSANYIDKIKQDLSLSEEYISTQSGIALRNIIHDYSYFRIETIDTFFQSILRNLARELNLTANLKIELNDYLIEQLAVDKLIEELDNKSKLLSWILGFVKENIDENKNWNVIEQIKKFGKNIFQDHYKSKSEELNKALKDDSFVNFRDNIRKIKNQALTEIQTRAKSFFEKLNENGLDLTDFSYGASGVCGYFVKLNNGIFDNSIITRRVSDAINDPEKWVKKSGKDKHRADIIKELVGTTLLPFLNETEEKRPQLWKLYKSAELTLRNLNQLRLLYNIETKVRDLNAETNTFLLSDTQTLLHSLIKNSDTPFIFEKIGTQIDHVMIDEFQDTGKIQWKNFKILLQECLSREQYGSLIVGDVKQSIYRWRSGDWKILNDISSYFSENLICLKNLDTNYRSQRNIIEFNNKFFSVAVNKEYENLCDEIGNNSYAEQLKRAYSDIEQNVPNRKGNDGYVNIELLPSENYQQNTLNKIYQIVTDLIASGVSQDRIAILVRSNTTIQIIADYFSIKSDTIKIISDEAFRIDGSIAVNIIINGLKLLINPDNKIALTYLIKAYQKYILQNNQNLSETLDINQLEKYLPVEFLNNRNKLLECSLFDTVEQLSIIFRLDIFKDEDAYIYTFFDCLNEFISDNTADITSFIDEWENNIHETTIHPNEINGVRLITIHKSKGLEFDNVIVPFCDWKVNKSSLIWCSPSEQPFATLPIVPIDWSKQLKGTIYENDYNEEYLQNLVDNLNLLYVAFTRASDNMFIIGKQGNKDSRSYLIEQSIPDIAEMLEGANIKQANKDNTQSIFFEYGSLYIPSKQKRKISQNIFLTHSENKSVGLNTYKNHTEFKQSNSSRDFIESDEANKQSSYIKTGAILHKLFSTIRTKYDIDKSLKQLDTDGLIYDCGMSYKQLKKLIEERISSAKAQEWFSDRWTVLNECTILSYDNDEKETVKYRPDRVMMDGDEVVVVDFKFGHQRPEYHDQVKRYMTLISSMGYKNVKGYLWFVYSNIIEEVL